MEQEAVLNLLCSQPHVLALPYPLPQVLQAPMVAITEINIDDSLLEQNK